MAITITERPTSLARAGQKLMVVATSTNVGEPNFRYIVTVTNEETSESIQMVIPPNPSNILIFDAKEIVKNWCSVSIYNYDAAEMFITGDQLVSSSSYLNNICRYKIGVSEGYDVFSVFTINEETIVEEDGFVAINAHHKVIDGYRPSFIEDYVFSGVTSKLLGNRNYKTHKPSKYYNGASSINDEVIWIPVRKSEKDYGSIQFVAKKTGLSPDFVYSPLVRMALYENDGTPNIATYLYEDYQYDDVFDLISLRVYPANLNQDTGMLTPSSFPNWRFYDIALYNTAGTSRKSVIYRFYPVDDDCRFDNVRLAWWDDEVGGFDFFNFTKKNEQSVEVERKRIKPVVGTYAAASFTFNNFDSELKEGFIDAVDYIDITSDWIQEGEFELLKHLVRSEAVYIVGDDGTLTPVLVENSSYTAKKERSAKLYNQTFRLRYSQQQIR